MLHARSRTGGLRFRAMRVFACCLQCPLLCSRGLPGFYEDVDTANRLAPCFRYDGSQLVFVSMTPSELLSNDNFTSRGKVGVKRVQIDPADAVDLSALMSKCRESCKVLSYRRFLLVLKRMQADAEVAMHVQMSLRYFQNISLEQNSNSFVEFWC
mmetsp:Transcript_21995/g.60241  ORF Transcript_21995/g.60241 Transcript_21995/m.60241 type:complete len:155 (+) Transcript_21995:87-551(+)